MPLKNVEAEFKYRSDDISREAFDALVETFGPFKKILELTTKSYSDGELNSSDHYWSNGKRFMRWRESTENNNKTWELTTKSKTSKLNNNVREEVNIPLIAKDMTFDKARAFSEQHKLKYDFSIGKNAKIFWTDTVVLSHYTVLNLKGKSIGEFLEIEANEDYPWENEAMALAEIVAWEKKLAPLGITPQHRVKRSLFEIYTTY